MKKKTIYVLSVILVCIGVLKAQGPEAVNECDHYIKEFGGPCLQGIPSDIFEKRKTVGLMPAENGEILGLTIDHHDFSDADKIFGSASQWHSGDAAASENKVCYIPQDGNKTVLILAANSEMSRGHVSEIRLIKGETNFLKNCKTVATVSKDFQTKSGIHVGMTENEIKAILGEPTASNDGLWFYAWQQGKELKPQDPGYSSCDKTDDKAIAFLTSFITGRFVNGTLEWITISSDSNYQCPY